MSSRAAAGRKRLQPVQDPRPTSIKTGAQGFFSRTKRPATSPPPSKPQKVTASSNPAGFSSWPHLQSDPLQSESSRDYPSAELGLPRNRGPVPIVSPPPDGRYRRPATSPGSGNISPEKIISSSQFPIPPSNTFGFLEATYQPPPPVKTSRSPTARTLADSEDRSHHARLLAGQGKVSLSKDPSLALPSQPRPVRIQSARPLPIYSDHSPTISEVHLESLGNSSLPQSLLLQPSPVTGLPAYASPISSNIPSVRPNLQIVATNLYSPTNMSSDDSSSQTRWGSDPSLLLPSPPSSNPHRSPVRSRFESPSLPSLVLSQDDGNSYQQLPNSGDAPYADAFTQTRNASDPAISTDSGDSLKSPIGAMESAKTSFVFPGCRSLARPRSTTKLNGQRANTGRSRMDSFGQTLSPISPTSPLSPTSNHPPRTQRVSMSSSSPRSVISARLGSRSSGSHSNSDEARGRLSSTPETVPESPAPFIYPSARTRAHPGVPTAAKFKFKGRTKKPPGEADQRSRFLGIPFKKKPRPETPVSPIAFETMSISAHSEDYTITDDQSMPDTQSLDSREEQYVVVQNQASDLEQRAERARRIKSRIGNYPLDPYDSVLLDNDRQTGELLHRLNPTGSPSFHDYGNTPPVTVLDLGCGQGHWVVDAAIAWKGYGTKVTGYDMVDISKGLLPWAAKQGVKNNIKFVRGNFLKQRLPFGDNTFDLVRMSCLTLCITSDAWVFVFQEVFRVLSLGGRLELIDDSIFFPYGKASPSPENLLPIPPTPRLNAEAPRLNITIPSSVFSTFRIYDTNSPNPGLGFGEEGVADDDDSYSLYQEDEEFDADDTATLNGRDDAPVYERDSPSPRATPMPRGQGQAAKLERDRESWAQHAATALDLEALFEHMLMHKFGITIYPEEFVLDLLKEVFGYAEETSTMHLTLASPDSSADEVGIRGRGDQAHRRMSTASGTLSQSPGLVLWPSTFIPMQQSEIEIHASKHLRMLLSCKNLLVEHAIEATEDEEIDEESVLEALYEYEGFLRQRFNPPPLEFGMGRDSSPASDTASQRGSIFSVSSECQDAMWEYQSELRQRFAWPGDLRPDSPRALKLQGTTTLLTSIPSNSSGTLPLMNPGPRVNLSNPDHSRSPTPKHSNPATPPYSREDLTHVRTFRVYEAIKLDESLLGTAI